MRRCGKLSLLSCWPPLSTCGASPCPNSPASLLCSKICQLTMSRLEVEVPVPPDQLFELLAHTHVSC